MRSAFTQTEADEAQIERQILRAMVQSRKVIVSNNGSVLDEATFPSSALIYLIARLNLHFPNLTVLCLETGVEYVDIPAEAVRCGPLIDQDRGFPAAGGRELITHENRQRPVTFGWHHRHGSARGAIGLIDRRRGANAQQAIMNLTPDVPVPGVAEGDGNFSGSKLYGSPVPLDKHRFLVSARGPVLVRNIDGTCVSTVVNPPDNGMQWFGA